MSEKSSCIPSPHPHPQEGMFEVPLNASLGRGVWELMSGTWAKKSGFVFFCQHGNPCLIVSFCASVSQKKGKRGSLGLALKFKLSSSARPVTPDVFVLPEKKDPSKKPAG